MAILAGVRELHLLQGILFAAIAIAAIAAGAALEDVPSESLQRQQNALIAVRDKLNKLTSSHSEGRFSDDQIGYATVALGTEQTPAMRADTYLLRAVAYARLRQTERALRDLDAVITTRGASEETLASAYFIRGQLRQYQHDYAGALADLDALSHTSPFYIFARYCHGGVNIRAGNVASGFHDLDGAIGLLPAWQAQSTSEYKQFAPNLPLEMRTRAAAQMDRMFRQTKATLYRGRGIALQRVGRLDEAYADYSAALDALPQNPGLYNRRAMVSLLRGHFERAWNDWRSSTDYSLHGQGTGAHPLGMDCGF